MGDGFSVLSALSRGRVISGIYWFFFWMMSSYVEAVITLLLKNKFEIVFTITPSIAVSIVHYYYYIYIYITC